MSLTFGCESCRRGWPHAHARTSDPVTSHEAAASVDHIRESQAVILDILQSAGPMTDEELWGCNGVRTRMSPSGARTRRAELVALGRVVDSGKKVTLASGRRAIVWAAK